MLTALAAVACALPAAASAAELPATPTTFASVFSAAQAGDTIRLATGSYGTFRGAHKPGTVTIAAQSGATPSMAVDFNPASNIALDGLKITSGYIGDYRTKNITIRNSDFDGAGLVLRSGPTDLVNANILLDNNVHSNRSVCTGCYDGRISIVERTDEPTGITIQNSLFYGGTMDGILNGGNGTRILNNEFRDIKQTDSSAHTDSIQLYGSKNTVIRGNYFHDVAVGIMCADGCDHETVEDNVFAVDGSPYAVTWLSDAGSVIRHNTFLDHGICDYGQRCGVLYLGNKSHDPVSRGTIVKDNILTRICVCDGTVSGLAEQTHNLFTGTAGTGWQDLFGEPTFAGGVNPSQLAGFALAGGSLGKADASDGADRGARIGVVSEPAPAPAPLPAPAPAPLPPPAPAPPAPAPPAPVPAAAPPAPAPAPPTPAATPAPAPAPPALAPDTSGRLVASFGFEETSGKTVRDGSGKANNGTISGARRITRGKHGRALDFDGIDDHVTVRDSPSLDLTRGMTLEAWVYPTARGSASRQVMLKQTRRGLAYGLYASRNRGGPAGLTNVGGDLGSAGRSRLPLKRWTHLAATYDGAAMRVFVNGRQVSRRSISGSMTRSSGPLKIGGNAIWGEWFKGRIDNVRVFDDALNSRELKAIMHVAA